MRVPGLIGAFAIVLAAQELDTVLHHNVRRSATVLDEIADPAERQLYSGIHRETNALNRRSLATRFLERFPASNLTAQVLEAASKAAIEMGDDHAALYYGRQSLRLYPENPLLLVPLAVVNLRQGRQDAARDFASAALDYLELFAGPASLGDTEWKRMSDELRKTAAAIAGERRNARRANPAAAYAGSAACRSCHADQFTAWQQTGMARMLRTLAPEAVFGDFGNFEYTDADNRLSARMSRDRRNFFLDLRRSGGEWDRYRVAFTIGSKWQQAYVTRSDSGELHVLPLQYNQIQKTWVNYWRTIDPPASERAITGDFHKLRSLTSYQQNCAPCHTSQIRPTGFREAGVNCEMCHGPSAAHVRGGPPPFRFSELTNREYVNVCAQCHAQSAIREPGGFPPRYKRRPYAEFSRRAFYGDGRFRETTFIVEAFERSACYRKGGANCGHCHNPHPSDAAANPVSLKFPGQPDRMCLQCHPAEFAGRKHTKHAVGSEGARCVSCHMPKIMNSLLFRARTHQIDDKPDAKMTARFGREESPNACLICHAERNTEWARDQLRSWQ